MINYPQPVGIDPVWLKAAARQALFNADSRSENLPMSERDLAQFIATGMVTPEDDGFGLPPSEPVAPPRLNWETYLDSSLGAYANFSRMKFEQSTLAEGAWDLESAYSAVEAQHLASLIRFHIAALFPARFNGRILRRFSPGDISYAALGVVIGADRQGFSMADLYISAYRRGWMSNTEYYAIYIFMLRLFADHLGRDPLILQGESAVEPFTSALFDHWRTDDLDLLARVSLAVCDLHTHRVKGAQGNVFHEFANGAWMRCPIELLLVFKLRQLNGMENPIVQHPLTGTSLGELPTAGTLLMDPLLVRVRARLEADGFNQNDIAAMP